MFIQRNRGEFFLFYVIAIRHLREEQHCFLSIPEDIYGLSALAQEGVDTVVHDNQWPILFGLFIKEE